MKNSLFLLFIVAIIGASFSSCICRKELPINYKTNRIDESKRVIIHTPEEQYGLVNYHFSDSVLIGDLIEKIPKKGYILHVYTDRNFDLGSEKKGHMVLSNSQITKMDYRKISIKKTVLLGSSYCIGASAAILFFFVSFGG